MPSVIRLRRLALLLPGLGLSACVASQPLSLAEVKTASEVLQRFNGQAVNRTFANDKTLLLTAEGDVSIGNVPWAVQGYDNTCGEAGMAVLLQYWGIQENYSQIAQEGNPLNLATSRDTIQQLLTAKGLAVEARNGSLDDLLTEIHQARPVLVLNDYGGLLQEHYLVVVGYNAHRGEILVNDSILGAYRPVTLATFLQRWENLPVVNLPLFGGTGYARLMFVVSPQEQAR